MTEPGPDAPVSLAEAAQRLGISYDAARRRIARGTLPAVKVGERWFVAAPDAGPAPDPLPNTSPDPRPDVTGPAPDVVISILQDEVGFLRSELESRAEEIRRRDHIIAGLVESMRALPAGTDAQTMPQERDPAPVRDDAAARAS
jgi:excisionase family DNA binding protein